MLLCFDPLMKKYENELHLTGVLLLRMEASMVFHKQKMRDISACSPNHTFMSLPMFLDMQLIEQVKNLVTLDPTGTMLALMGIPPRVKMLEMFMAVHEELKKKNPLTMYYRLFYIIQKSFFLNTKPLATQLRW